MIMIMVHSDPVYTLNSLFKKKIDPEQYDYVFPGKNIAAAIVISQNQLDFGDLMTAPSLS
jgi:hypothetical protein